MEDPELLQRYTATRDESAFTELVQRHLGLVYHTALRRLNGDAHHAHDVSQTVFTLLARKAPSLTRHPTLTGWLYTAAINTARDLIRAEQRRLARENQTHAMEDKLSSAPSDESWQQLRPVIDDALSELKTADRDALLLRYFEDRPLSQVASTLHLSEDAARMKVNRALEKLREALSKRGVTSTAAAVASILAPHAALAAPAGLATQISGITLSLVATGALTTGSGATALTFFKIMTTSKIVSGTVIVLSLGLVAYQSVERSQTRSDLAALKSENARLLVRTQSLESELTDARRKIKESDEDTGNMLAVLETTKNMTPKTDDSPITRDSVDSRYKRAQNLAKTGQHESALQDYLWCFDTGMKQVSGFTGVRLSYLLSAVADLGKNYPPALTALQQRRGTAAKRFEASRTDSDALMDLGAINHALGEDSRNLALFDSIPPGDTNRTALAHTISKQLIEARRYNDLAQAMPFSRMNQMFDMTAGRIENFPEKNRAIIKRGISSSAAQNIEVLAGAGDLDHAKQLMQKVLAFDSSPETKALIQKHLARAGRPELLTP
jgi:RNA polymerase sigma factor (sigma-70 family)